MFDGLSLIDTGWQSFEVVVAVGEHKEVVIDYVTYKKNSIILEESQQLKFAIALKNLGYKIKILDDRDEVKQQLKDIL